MIEVLNYIFSPTEVEICKQRFPKPSVAITVVGSKDKTPDDNQLAFGAYIAKHIATEVISAKEGKKYLILDTATGGTPKAVWPAIHNMVMTGKLKLDDVIVYGHEEAWGRYPEGSASDFDAERKRTVFEGNSVAVKDITTEKQVSGERIDGNFVPMHLESVDRKDFPDGLEGDEAFLEAELLSAKKSAARFTKIIRRLARRKDVIIYGMYGVGNEGHVAEMQINMMGKVATKKRQDAFVYPKPKNSFEGGLFLWKKDGEGFYKDSNVMWKRGARSDENVGRAQWQGYGIGADFFMGIGWLDMMRVDNMMLAFNNQSKALAFQLAMEGSIDGTILDEQGNEQIKIQRNAGEAENIYPELASYAQMLEKQEFLAGGTVDNNQTSDELKCHGLFQAIYQTLDAREAAADDLQYREQYEKLWEFMNRYVGKRAPVAQLIRARALLGKRTEIVLTPEVVKGTKYKILTENQRYIIQSV